MASKKKAAKPAKVASRSGGGGAPQGADGWIDAEVVPESLGTGGLQVKIRNGKRISEKAVPLEDFVNAPGALGVGGSNQFRVTLQLSADPATRSLQLREIDVALDAFLRLWGIQGAIVASCASTCDPNSAPATKKARKPK